MADVLAGIISKALGDVTGIYDTTDTEDKAIAETILAAGFGLVQEAGAVAWDEGFASGKSRAMRHMSDEPGLPLSAPNPYRAVTVRGVE